MKNIMKAAHKMAKEIKSEYPNVNYKFQLGLCISYLAKEGENNMMTRENNVILNKAITNLENLQEVKFNKIFAEKAINDATEMFNAGWDKLEDGIVVMLKGNLVAVKKGNTIVKYEMKEFNVNMGKLDGNIAREVGIMEVSDNKKEAYTAQTIITKYYTIRRA